MAAWLLLTAACREINPDYDGPVTSGGATETAGPGSETEPTAGSSGRASSDDDGTASSSSGGPGSSSSGPSDPDEGCMGMTCNGECIDPQTNDDHCGQCDHKCNGQKECIAGECQNP